MSINILLHFPIFEQNGYRGNLARDETSIHSSLSNDVQVDRVVDLGLHLESVLSLTADTLEKMNAVSYFTSAISLTITSFVLLTQLTLNEVEYDAQYYGFSTFYFFLCLLFYTRLYFLMITGQYLITQMKNAKISLENFRLNQEVSLSQFNFQKFYKMELLQDRIGNDSPIAPFSIFSLSIGTFARTLATIVTYIVILIRMRGFEDSKYEATGTKST